MNDLVTVGQLAAEIQQFKRHIQNLENAHELEFAILQNRNTPLVQWKAAKKNLDI